MVPIARHATIVKQDVEEWAEDLIRATRFPPPLGSGLFSNKAKKAVRIEGLGRNQSDADRPYYHRAKMHGV